MDETPAGGPRSPVTAHRSPSFGALRHRNFRLFIFGQFVSLCGSWMQTVALGWLALELSNSALQVGLVTTFGSPPPARTVINPVFVSFVAKTIVSSPLQTAPRAFPE